MEEWNTGIMKYWVAIVAQPISDLASFLKAFIPPFHHLFQQGRSS
jgi:hypothetical protein